MLLSTPFNMKTPIFVVAAVTISLAASRAVPQYDTEGVAATAAGE
jgi:hypothetical protein